MKQNCFPTQSGVGFAPQRAKPYAAAMTIAKSIHRIFVSLALAGAGVSLFGWEMGPAEAASTSADISAVILQGASVGVVNALTPAPTIPTVPPSLGSSRDI